MPRDRRWTQPQPWLVTAALALAQGQDCTSETFLSTAEGMLAHLPAAEIPSRLTASLTRLALARRTGDLDAAAAAAGQAQELAQAMPEDELARHPGVHAQVLAGCGAVQLWQGHFEEAAARFRSGAMAARLALTEAERTSCLGHLALIEVIRGRLSYAAELAAEATGRLKDDRGTPAEAMNGAAAVALAGVHLERVHPLVNRASQPGEMPAAGTGMAGRGDERNAAACLLRERLRPRADDRCPAG
jgi:LuxR family maltose regulon positive regulatory protein